MGLVSVLVLVEGLGLERLVALVEDEVLDVLGDEVLLADELQDAPRRADDDVRAL